MNLVQAAETNNLSEAKKLLSEDAVDPNSLYEYNGYKGKSS
jgi:hypothetical protein